MPNSPGTKSEVANTKPVWSAEDQNRRLAELISNEPDVKEAPLRRDVRSLGRLLGEVLKEQGGVELFAAVEEIRQLAIEHRDLELEARGERPRGRSRFGAAIRWK